MNPFELTRQLMSIPSVTGREGELGAFLSSHLAGLGYRVDRQNVTADRFNILAFNNGEPRVLLCTHIDTVPPILPVMWQRWTGCAERSASTWSPISVSTERGHDEPRARDHSHAAHRARADR